MTLTFLVDFLVDMSYSMYLCMFITGALADAERELEELLGQKRWIDQRIAVLRDAIANMQYLGENQQPPQENRNP